MTSAQGQEITKKVMARITHSRQTPASDMLIKSGGITAKRTAPITTVGVYIRAKRVMKFSLFDLFSAELSTRASILWTVDSENGLVTFILSTPPSFTQPLRASSPTPTSRGRDSPVSATVLNCAPTATTAFLPRRELKRGEALKSLKRMRCSLRGFPFPPAKRQTSA